MPPATSNASQRRGVPATASTPNTVADSTSIVPRSGCSMIRVAGTPAMASMPSTVPRPTGLRRPSVRSATSSAIPMTTASLANSAGCTDMPPNWIHDRDPLIVVPLVSTSTSPPIEAR